MSTNNMSELNTTISDGRLIIEIPISEELRPSSTGKTLLVASSGGAHRSSQFIDGKPVYVVFNAFVYP